MGASAVRTVYGRWGHLPDRPFRVLAFMALVSMDGDDKPLFWGGRDSLGIAIGRFPVNPDDVSENAQRERRAAAQAVKVAVSVLVSSGAVSVYRKSAPGRSAVYQLHLDGPVDNLNGVGQPYPTGKGNPTDRGRESLPRDGGVGGVKFETIQEQSRNQITLGDHLTCAVENEAELEIRYVQAQSVLAKLPDLGAGYMTRVQEIEGMRNRVIAAAILCQEAS